MTGDPGRRAGAGGEPPGDGRDDETEARRRRRRAEVFGEVLPDTTGDDREPGGSSGDSDDWLRSNVPPHHG